MYTHRLAVRCVNDPAWVDEFLKYVDENPNSCQEVWLCSSYAFPPIEKHREFARGMKPALEKFKAREKKHNSDFTGFLNRKYKAVFDILLFSDLSLYRKIESRGFYIKINDKGVTCLNSIILSGELKMNEKPEGLSETSMTN